MAVDNRIVRPALLSSEAINAQTGDYHLTHGDVDSTVIVTSGAAHTVTVDEDPADSTTGLVATPFIFPVGARVRVVQGGAGQVTIAAGAGTTLEKNAATAKLAGQWALAELEKIGPSTWLLSGNLAAS